MEGETTKQIRVTIPLDVYAQIERTAAALGVTVNDLGARCVVEGVVLAIEKRIVEMELSLAALKREVGHTETNGNDAAGDEPPKQGRAEKQAAVRKEELAQSRRRKPGSA